MTEAGGRRLEAGGRTRILVTGTAAIASTGLSAGDLWEALREGRSGIGPIRQWDASRWPWPSAAEIPGFDPRVLVPDRKLHKMLSRMDLLGLRAAADAVADSGLLPHRDGLAEADRGEFNERTAVVAASGGGCYRNQYDFLPLLARAGESMAVFGEELLSTVTPMWLLRTLPNNVLCYAGVATGFKGPNANFTSHSASGLLAILEATRMLRDGEADRALVIGYDAPVEPQAVLHYGGLGILAADRIRPFDAARTGSILGEGAGAIVIETEASAARRGARVRGEILGGGAAAEGEGLVAIREDGDGVLRALREALADAATAADALALVAAHGNGTPRSDLSEGRALLSLLGREGPPVTAFKWSLGHLLAASGIVETVLALRALEEGIAPGIAALERLDPALEGLPACREHRPLAGDRAAVISRGFGGTAAALVVGRHRGAP